MSQEQYEDLRALIDGILKRLPDVERKVKKQEAEMIQMQDVLVGLANQLHALINPVRNDS